jgi:hypothetical protein
MRLSILKKRCATFQVHKPDDEAAKLVRKIDENFVKLGI